MRWRWGLLLLLPLLLGGGYLLNDIQPNSVTVTQITAQTIGAGGIIAADQCGGFKLISAAGAVNTDATNGIAVSTTAGCCFNIVNVSSGANTITLLHSTNILSLTGGNVAIAQNSIVSYCTNGTKWFQIAPLGTNS